MKRIFDMAIKDLRLLARDKMGAFFIVGFPILMGLFFGLIMGAGGGGGGDRAKMEIAIVDNDQSEFSGKFVKSLMDNELVNVSLDQIEPAKESVRKGNRVALLVIEKGFGDKAGVFWGEPPTIKVGVDPSRSAESAMLQGFVMESIGQLASSRFQDSSNMTDFIEQSRADLKTNKTMSATNRMLMSAFLGSVEDMVGNIDALQQQPAEDGSDASSEGEAAGGFEFANIESMDIAKKVDPNSIGGQLKKSTSKWDISFPQAMMWGVLACCAGFAISIAKEHTNGTMTRLQVAPVSKFEILAGKALACFIATVAVIVMMTILGVSLGMKPYSYPKLFVAASCVAFCFVGIMMTMSVLGKTEQSVSGAGWAINMIMAMIGGCMIPVMFMPGFMQKLSVLSPIRWGIVALEGAIWRQFSYAEMLMPCAILIGVGALGVCIGTVVLSKR
ncbi:MAG: ABC transporter permease [Mariniblastus sp.]